MGVELDGNSEDTEYKANDAQPLVRELFSGKLPIKGALERLRARLLDLSSRNRPLNYRHPKGRCIQFVDEPNLNTLFDRLYEDSNKSILLKPVPEPDSSAYERRRPDARQYAQELGIKISFEFPESALGPHDKRRFRGLQTLFYPSDLEKLLKKISHDAKTAIEETGTNMLFLVFGFMEFYDSEDSDRPLFAPLLSVPVMLSKGNIDSLNRVYQYNISHSGEDLAENQTLREKMKQDFSLNLPEFEDIDEPETYFKKIEQTIRTRKRWKVRRQLSLGLLSFGKLAIWADLDTKKYPEILRHPLLKTIFEGASKNGGNQGFLAEDYEIDKHPSAGMPIIYDADSSQHSAIIDVLSEKNMVIIGPPGTGKSQTITNIIAAVLKDGKKVIFVSEKLAALEVF